MTNIYVGNLNFRTTEDDLRSLFSQYGSVERVNVVTDRDIGQPRGFAFVEMADRKNAEDAISRLNDTEVDGRALRVSEAQPKACGRRWFRRQSASGR